MSMLLRDCSELSPNESSLRIRHESVMRTHWGSRAENQAAADIPLSATAVRPPGTWRYNVEGLHLGRSGTPTARAKIDPTCTPTMRPRCRTRGGRGGADCAVAQPTVAVRHGLWKVGGNL
jgi:hypothetical protein